LDIYRNLQEHLDQLAVGFPATESGVEIRILKHLFEPEEATLATKLTDKYESLDLIYQRAKGLVSSMEGLKEKLDHMVSKGSIHCKIVNGERQYANAYLVLGMYEYQINRLTKSFLEDFNEYLLKDYGLEVVGYDLTQFRTIPVEKSITPEHNIPSYEELREIVKNGEGPITIQECVCRKSHDLLEGSCKITSRKETCMGFGHLAQMYIDEGWGRSISKEEALEILRKNEEEGLVLQGQNNMRPGFICSCCGDCCKILTGLKIFPNPAHAIKARYHAEIDPELCVGCETCIERCQMNAIKMRKDKSKVNPKRCIGCGNCVVVCPSEAIQLVKNKNAIDTPENEDDMFEKILESKLRIKGKK
jgi:ferredoxin